MSICLVRAWYWWSLVSSIADWLSQKNVVGAMASSPRARHRARIETNLNGLHWSSMDLPWLEVRVRLEQNEKRDEKYRFVRDRVPRLAQVEVANTVPTLDRQLGISAPESRLPGYPTSRSPCHSHLGPHPNLLPQTPPPSLPAQTLPTS